VFLVDAGDFDAISPVHGEIFKEVRPANTTLVVAGFLNDEWRLEVEVDAVLRLE
jgi:enamine deaminase RidA (YjgF/YER057c/UK114 family)